ncbi:MAG: hypothetical protein IM333_18550 [Microcystis sp. M048S1]|nr:MULTISPECIES: hypothetical protein [unclassified Microcystis]NCQ98783.1 hypothetical protein [Microcystis aeruginosa L211-11]NCR30282.1 hypothetical protein [Microcystis aeruginosa L211-101]MCA2747085.1 hypothetical protein [Microcystis sp. M155S2]MCA2776849.1 hypothetical protein [Microcystis sp. M135S2]MCA2779686.1 hypothetical protein [Microcystis sp. M136S2]
MSGRWVSCFNPTYVHLEKETFPHIYGAINLESVVFVKPLQDLLNS